MSEIFLQCASQLVLKHCVKNMLFTYDGLLPTSAFLCCKQRAFHFFDNYFIIIIGKKTASFHKDYTIETVE